MFNRRKKNLLFILLLVAIVIGVGTAFTAANTIDAHAGNKLGYGTQNVTGAHVTSMDYALSADGTTVATVTFKAAGDLTQGVPAEAGYVGFTYDPGSGPVVGPNAPCTAVAPAFDGTSTTFTCDVSGLASAEVTVANISDTNIAVAN
jgi:hypothetical protein